MTDFSQETLDSQKIAKVQLFSIPRLITDIQKQSERPSSCFVSPPALTD